MSDNVTALPTKITFDLDSEEKDDVKEPFVAQVGGRPLTFADPEDLDWQDLLDIEQPTDFIRYTLSDEDRQHLFSQALPGWKLGKLMETYMKHYGLDKKMQQFQREQRRGF